MAVAAKQVLGDKSLPWDEMKDAILNFAASKVGGTKGLKGAGGSQRRKKFVCIAEGCPCRVVVRCKGSDRQVRQRDRQEENWSVDFSSSKWAHRTESPPCCSKPILTPSRLMAVNSLVLSVRQSACQKMVKINKVVGDLRVLGYDIGEEKSAQRKAVRKVVRVFVQSCFRAGPNGLEQNLNLLPAWVSSFNRDNHGKNGLARLGTYQDAQSGVPTFHFLTLVFQASVSAFLHCSLNILSIDAAFLCEGREDQAYMVLMAHSSDNTIFPLAFHLCFRETTQSYVNFWQTVFDYNHELCSRIDSLDIRITGDRHGAIRKAMDEVFDNRSNMLYSDLEHLTKNACQHSGLQVNKLYDARKYVREVAASTSPDELISNWAKAQAFNAKFANYLKLQRPEWWVALFFKPVLDGGKVTSNDAESQNGRYKSDGTRRMSIIDMLNQVCTGVDSDMRTFVENARQRMDSQRIFTAYAQKLFDKQMTAADSYSVYGDAGLNGPVSVCCCIIASSSSSSASASSLSAPTSTCSCMLLPFITCPVERK